MVDDWESEDLESEKDVFRKLLELQGKKWLSRGHSECYPKLVPKIDRDCLVNLPRAEKLKLERESIDLFRSTARFFASPGEAQALTDDISALMVLRHYGVPTRLLDWSMSPYVAAYFAVCCKDDVNGEIWSFDEPQYENVGKKQWGECPETTRDGKGNPDKFDAKLTAFRVDLPPKCDWFIAVFYDPGFPRQNAQAAAYSMTAQFGRCHAEAIRKLLGDKSSYRRYVVKAALKPKLREMLRGDHGIWRGSLFPDTAGAATLAMAKLAVRR